MDIYDAISVRRTVRDFSDRPIDASTLERVLGAGLRAPSNDHMRNWAFVVVNDRDRREELIAAISKDRSPAQAESIVDEWGLADTAQRGMYLDAIPKQYRMLLSAGALIIPCYSVGRDILTPRTLSDLNPFASIWCCIENILLAAAAEGIFGVTRIPAEEERPHILSVLEIPAEYDVPCYLALGYPTANAAKIVQKERTAAASIHVGCW